MAHNPVSAGDPASQCTRPAQQLVETLDYKTTAFARLPGVTQRFGHSRGKVYLDIEAGVFVPGVAIGRNTRAWPNCELDLYAVAYIRGFSAGELRELTQLLMQARRNAGLFADHNQTDQRTPASVPQMAQKPEDNPGGRDEG